MVYGAKDLYHNSPTSGRDTLARRRPPANSIYQCFTCSISRCPHHVVPGCHSKDYRQTCLKNVWSRNLFHAFLTSFWCHFLLINFFQNSNFIIRLVNGLESTDSTCRLIVSYSL